MATHSQHDGKTVSLGLSGYADDRISRLEAVLNRATIFNAIGSAPMDGRPLAVAYALSISALALGAYLPPNTKPRTRPLLGALTYR